MSLNCGRKRVVLSEQGMERLVHGRETPGDSAMTSFLYILDFVRVCGRCEVCSRVRGDGEAVEWSPAGRVSFLCGLVSCGFLLAVNTP